MSSSNNSHRVMPRRLVGTSLFVLTMCVTSPAFAGTSGSTMGQDIVNTLNEYVGFMTGPIVPVIAALAAGVVLVGAMLTGANGDTMKRLVVLAALVAGVISAPSIANQIANAAGGVI